jgi:hypothetical protein
MKRIAIVLLLIATPVLAEQCVVVRQEGVLRGAEATPDKVAQGVPFACSMDDNAALYHYLQEVKRLQDEECPRCFPNSPPWSRR